MASLEEIMDALAAQLDTTLTAVIPDLQVDGKLVPNPTPPCIDIYPGDPFFEPIAYGEPVRLLLHRARSRDDRRP